MVSGRVVRTPNPRKLCSGKTYKYTLRAGCTVAKPRSPIAADRCWCIAEQIDLDLLLAAAACLVGSHDFASFGSGNAEAQEKSSLCTITRFDAAAVELTARISEVTFTVTGDRFVHNQVRNMVGYITAISTGRIAGGVESVRALLDVRDYRARPPQVMAPGCGLVLWAVHLQRGVLTADGTMLDGL